jgi:hypothetical protein
MGARHKLNTVVVWGCLIVSAFFGLAAESWGVFWGVLAVTVGGCYTAGDIRTQPTRRLSKSGPESKVGRPPSRHRRD